MSRFAHIGDCHIGAWRDQKLRQKNNEIQGKFDCSRPKMKKSPKLELQSKIWLE